MFTDSATGLRRGVEAMRAVLLLDGLWLGFLSVFVSVHLPLFVTWTRPELLSVYSSVYLELLLLPVVVGALLLGRRQPAHAAERRFWTCLAFAVFLWWIVRLLNMWIPSERRGIEDHLAIDSLYLLFYLGLLIAVETRPHDPLQDARWSSTRGLDTLGLSILVATSFVYFVLIPSYVTPETYATWVPSLVLYLTFDLMLAVRFTQLAWAARSTRWRQPYGLLAVTSLLWGVLDLLEIFWHRGIADWLDATWTNVLWQLPLLSLVLASRLRRQGSPGREDAVAETMRPGVPSRAGNLLPLATLVLPAAHLSLSLFGLIEAPTRALRESVVLVGLIALGGLALIERARAQRQSLHQNTHLASLIDSTPLPVVLLDSTHRAITCNPAFEALFLYSRAEIVGQNIDLLIVGEDSQEDARAITRRVLEGESTFTVARRSRSDGNLVDVRIFGVPLKAEGRLIGVFAIYQDLTERMRAEETLKESQERFRRLAEAAFEGILLSEEGVVIDSNQQAADMFGLTTEQMIGSALNRRVVKQQQQLVAERIQSGYEKPYELTCYRKDRSEFLIEVQGKSIPYKGRQARVTVFRDITERRRLEAQLVQSQKMEAIGRLAAGIAHDFNNLLTIMLGRGALLERHLPHDTQPREWAAEITGAAERAGKMTRQLLAFGRKQPLHLEVLDLNQVVAGMESTLRGLIREDVSLSLALAPEALEVPADPSQIEQVIMNLAINAGDAMPDGGELSIATTGVEIDGAQEYKSLGVALGAYACLTVKDTGTGMAAETLAHAFEPFFTTKIQGEGTGLGLATVHGIVKQSRGGITVDSAVGRGTTFQVYLPRHSESG